MGLHFSEDRFLREFSTFGIGGPIRYFAKVSSSEEMREGFFFAKTHSLPLLILGKGSNCLFDDRGFSGVVLLNKVAHCSFSGEEVTVGSGYSFPLLGTQTAKRHLSGLEFACAIPATIGGALFMNAGANGSEISTYLTSADFLHLDGTLRTYPKEQLSFGYRFSSFQQMQGAILSATFCFPRKDIQVRETQLKIISYRKQTQPLTKKSAGCIFRNPGPEMPAGKLIEQCKLKGFSLGDAKVSEKHANFIINQGQARASDVLELIATIQEEVKRQTGIALETEVRWIPYE